jgi:hypothetical protein
MIGARSSTLSFFLLFFFVFVFRISLPHSYLCAGASVHKENVGEKSDGKSRKISGSIACRGRGNGAS